MGVIKSGAVRSENKPGTEAFWKPIRKHDEPLHVQDFERRVIRTALPDRVREETTIRRDRGDRDSYRVPASTLGWVNQNGFRPKQPVPHDYVRLLPVFLALEEKVVVADVPRLGDNFFDSQQLSNPCPNSLSVRNRIEIRACVGGLFFEPLPRSRRVLILEPPIWIRDLDSVQDFGYGFDQCRRRCIYCVSHMLTLPNIQGYGGGSSMTGLNPHI
jgi:hypothetical protein